MYIPFYTLKKQYRLIEERINKKVLKIIKRQQFILGEEVSKFEKKFADYIGVSYGVGVNSGTDGLILALKALHIGPGDEVITQPNSFIATAIAISTVGARPVFADIDRVTHQIDPSEIEKKINKNTKAILPVHLYGAMPDMEKIKLLARKYNLFLIEDACQAHGSKYKDSKAGSWGDLAVFSFYPSKNLGCYGDGGMVVTNRKEIYNKLLLLRNYGQSKKYIHDTYGINSRLDEIQAAVLAVKLQYLDRWNKARNKRVLWYKRYLSQVPSITIPHVLPDVFSCYHLFVIEHSLRDKLASYLKKRGIETLIHYPVPIHLQRMYQDLGYKKGDFPNCELVANRILSLPMYPEISKSEIQKICNEIVNFTKSVSKRKR